MTTATIKTMDKAACAAIRNVVADSNLADALKAWGVNFEIGRMTFDPSLGSIKGTFTFTLDGALLPNAIAYQRTARMARMDPAWLNKPITMKDGRTLTIVGWNDRARRMKVDVTIDGREMKCTAEMARDEYERVLGKYNPDD